MSMSVLPRTSEIPDLKASAQGAMCRCGDILKNQCPHEMPLAFHYGNLYPKKVQLTPPCVSLEAFS
jgi:hypothetical protein